MQHIYIILDTISLAIIIGIMYINKNKGGAGGMGQIGMNKNKKF